MMLEISEHVYFKPRQEEGSITMEEKKVTFGGYVREKRLAAHVNLRKLAEILDIAPAYMSDIENDHRYPPEKEKISKIAEALHLTQEETDYLFDLAAGNKKNSVSPDIITKVRLLHLVKVEPFSKPPISRLYSRLLGLRKS